MGSGASSAGKALDHVASTELSLAATRFLSASSRASCSCLRAASACWRAASLSARTLDAACCWSVGPRGLAADPFGSGEGEALTPHSHMVSGQFGGALPQFVMHQSSSMPVVPAMALHVPASTPAMSAEAGTAAEAAAAGVGLAPGLRNESSTSAVGAVLSCAALLASSIR